MTASPSPPSLDLPTTRQTNIPETLFTPTHWLIHQGNLRTLHFRLPSGFSIIGGNNMLYLRSAHTPSSHSVSFVTVIVSLHQTHTPEHLSKGWREGRPLRVGERVIQGEWVESLCFVLYLFWKIVEFHNTRVMFYWILYFFSPPHPFIWQLRMRERERESVWVWERERENEEWIQIHRKHDMEEITEQEHDNWRRIFLNNSLVPS